MASFEEVLLSTLSDADFNAITSGDLSSLSNEALERLSSAEENKVKFDALEGLKSNIDRSLTALPGMIDPETKASNARAMRAVDDGGILTGLKETPRLAGQLIGGTLGAGLGGAGGAFVGGAGGTAVAPGIGTVAGAGTGAVLGAGVGGVEGSDIGGAAGEYLTRAITGALGDDNAFGDKRGFMDLLSANRSDNNPLENPVEYALNGLGGLGAASRVATLKNAVPSSLVTKYGSAPKALERAVEGAEELSKGATEPFLSVLGANSGAKGFTSAASKLRDKTSTVAQKAVEILSRPEMQGSTQWSQVANKVAGLADEAGAARLSLVKGADDLGATIVPVVDDVLKEISAKTGALLPVESGLTDDVIDSASSLVMQAVGGADEASFVVDDVLNSLEALKVGMKPSEALQLSQSLRELRNKVMPYGANKEAFDSFSSVVDNISSSLEGAIKQSITGASASGRRGYSFDPQAFDSITNELNTLYKLKGLFGTVAPKVAGTQATKAANATINATNNNFFEEALGLGGKVLRPVVSAANLTNKSASPAEQAINSMNIGRDALDEIALLNKAGLGGIPEVATQNPLSRSFLNTQVAPAVGAGMIGQDAVDQAMALGAPAEAQAEQLDPNMMSVDPAGNPFNFLPEEPLLDGIDTESFYANKINQPDSTDTEEDGQVELPQLERSSGSVMEYISKVDPDQTGIPKEQLDAAKALLSGDSLDQKEGVYQLIKAAPQLFGSSKLPGIESLVDDVVVDPMEQEKLEARVSKSLQSDPARKFEIINRLRSGDPLPSWSYKYMGGEEQETFEDAFLKKEEGLRTKAYLDTRGFPTIGIGVNLAVQTPNSLRDLGVPETTIAKLSPLLGATGNSARSRIKTSPVQLDEAEAMELSKLIKQKSRDALESQYKQETGASLEDLPVQARTVLLSLAFNFGDVRKKLPTLWNHAVMGRWDQASNFLKKTKWKQPELKGRRMREAGLLDEIAPETIQLAANVDYDDDATSGTTTLENGQKIQTYKF